LQAFSLKKYRRSTSPVSSISDNEDATAPLRNSEPLCVQNCPLDKSVSSKCEAGVFPFSFWNGKLGPSHFSKYRRKVISSSGAEQSGDVFGQGESASVIAFSPSNNLHCTKEESAASVIPCIINQPFPFPGYGQVLAWKPKHNQVERSQVSDLLLGNLLHIPKVRYVWVVMRQNSRREGIDLRDSST